MKEKIIISDKCKDCIYYQDVLKILNITGLTWASSQPHPCMTCVNLKQDDKSDNFIKS